MSKWERRWMAAGATVALSAGMWGCGSDGDNAGTTVAADEGKATGAPIVIGTSGPYSSNVIALPEARDAVQAAAESINAKGGINGRPLRIVPCDDHLDPNQAAACGRKFASDEEMVAVAGSASVQGDFFEPALEKAELADVGGYPVAAPSLKSPVSFPLQGGTYIQYAGTAKVIADRKYKRPVVLYHDIPTIKMVLQAIDTTLGEAGIEVAGKIAIPPTATDMSAAVAKARTYDPDVVLLAFPEPQISQAIQTEHQTGNKLPLITGAGDLSTEALEKLGPAADGVTSVASLPPQDAEGVPALESFAADMDKYAPDAERTAISLNSWAAVQMLAHVLEGLDTIDRASVLKAMNGLSDYDSDGLTLPIDFTAKPAVAELPRLFNTGATVTEIADGKQQWNGDFLDAVGR